MIIAITGNIGSGKSTAGAIFEKHGYTLINADFVGHDLYERSDILRKVVRKFGKDVLTDGEVDRAKLKHIVFYNAEKLKELNKIMHPEIVKEVKRRIKKAKGNVAIEAALLLEVRFKDYDKLLLITIDRKKQMQRLLKKGKYTRTEIMNIINAQTPQERIKKYADIIIDNSTTKKEFEKKIMKVIESI